MKKTLLFITALGGFSLFLASYDNGAATHSKDRTGSPVSNLNCGQCHGGGGFSPSISAQLLDATNTPVTSYNPGATYTWKITITAGAGNPNFGFQTVALLSNNSNAGTLSAQSANTKVVTLGGRKYGEHPSPSTTGVFMLNWVAPASGSGTVKFYTTGNCGNNNNNDTGDSPSNLGATIITENTFAGIEDVAQVAFTVFPNPASESIRIQSELSGNYMLELIDVSGKIVYTENIVLKGVTSGDVNVASFDKGIYLVRLTSANQEIHLNKVLIK
ncbi:MAG: T9SS type A sorting domain-containing protein [Flavobacteriales bacterium]|nr:T9SS type A sorting domain-containing protein [Flavobacteriales bacterium]